MKSERVVVVGTGTGIGKTHVSCALVAAWSDVVGVGRVWGCKPIESGVIDEASSDSARLREASSFHVKRTVEAGRLPPAPAIPTELLSPPYRFQKPISPHLAALRAGTRVDLGVVRRWVEGIQATGHVVIETAGGLCSPLGPELTNLHLATSLSPARWLIVAPDRLGVLHDVAAVRAVLTQAGCDRPPALVLSSPPEPDASTGTNGSELLTLGLAERVTAFPRVSPYDPLSASAARAVLSQLGLL